MYLYLLLTDRVKTDVTKGKLRSATATTEVMPVEVRRVVLQNRSAGIEEM
jgi:hypothetical protein